MKSFTLVATAFALSAVSGKVYFEERFNDDTQARWIQSEFKKDYGKFKFSSGKFFANEKVNQGLQTTQDAHFYAISADLDSPFENKGKDLVLQFSAKFEQDIDCGGGYIKLAPKFDPKTFGGETKYNIMFGPDVCGSDRKVHAILNYKDDNKLIKRFVNVPNDLLTHQYTLAIHADKTYDISIDNEQKVNGTLLEDWDFLPEKEVEDVNDKKPEDWVDEALIDDPEDKKPEGWVDGPETIPDPDAIKPEDWNDEDDGEWERPTIPNPDFKGEWLAKRIANPEYKGEWTPKKIANPEYKEDDTIGQYVSESLGFDLWQVKSGTIFDNILVTDDLEYAKKFSETHFELYKKLEVEAKDAYEKEQEEESEKLRKEAEEKANKEEEETSADEESKDDSKKVEEADEAEDDKDEL